MNTVWVDAWGALLAGLPLAVCLLLVWIFRSLGERWRDAAMDACASWGVCLALSTEALSVPRLITRAGVALVWLCLALGLLALGRFLETRRALSRANSGAARREDAGDSAPLAARDWLPLCGATLLIALVASTAVLSAPNTWDAMAYHMSRVAQWMTNRDVALYPAFYSAQLFLSPWSEYAMLHLDLLFGADRLVNLVEWTSMIGAIVGGSLIAQRLGAGRRGQIFAAVACATISNGVLEASGPANTYVGAFWIVVAVYYLLRWNDRQSWRVAIALGASIGLAILTKGTAYILLPCVLLACWWMGEAAARKGLLRLLPAVALVVLVLNGPLYLRNYRLSGSPLGFSHPLGDDVQRQYANSRFSLGITFANVVKNLALHVVTPSNALNGRISRFTLSGLRTLGIDPNDPDSTYRGGFHFNALSLSESRVGNPIHLALIVLSLLLLFRAGIGDRKLRLYALGLIGSFILFCALMRWQNDNARYHLPLFVLGMALVAVVLERACPRNLLTAVAWLLIIAALPFALLNSLRPLVPFKGRTILRTSWTETYFADNHDYLVGPYESAARAALATPCHNIGVDASLEDFDYPMFALLAAGRGERVVRYAGVHNFTAEYARPGGEPPCLVVCLRCAYAPAKWAEYRAVGPRASVFGEVAVFGPQGDLPNEQTVALPDPSERERIFARLDHYRESPPPISLAEVDSRVERADRDWPAKRPDLKTRLDELYTAGISLWRVRDSVDPLRKLGQPVDHSKIDPLQVLAAMEVTEHWYNAEPAKIEELNGLTAQLYSSWQTRLVSVSPAQSGNHSSCSAQIEIDESQSGRSTVAKETRIVDLPECTCLGSAARSGALLSSKPLGVYDTEAQNLTGCRVSDSRPADVPGLWAPAPRVIASAP